MFCLSKGLELHSEVAHEGSLPYDLDTASDLFATVIDVLEGCGDHLHVVVGVNATGDSETEQVE